MTGAGVLAGFVWEGADTIAGPFHSSSDLAADPRLNAARSDFGYCRMAGFGSRGWLNCGKWD